MKKIAADTHVHMYPCYRIQDALQTAFTNLDWLAGTADARALVLFLTERAGSHFFRDLVGGKVSLTDGWHATPAADGSAIIAERSESHARLLILNGRQIATRERLEVLVLGCDPRVPDGAEARRAIEAALAAGAAPVLPWAAGKWSFDRGRIVEGLLDAFLPGQLLIGDTTMRPALSGEPHLMKLARRKGFKIIAGSDPLPIPGEERLVGQYGVTWNGSFDESRPAAGLVRMLLDPACALTIAGRRDSAFGVLRRMAGNYCEKRRGKKAAADAL